MLNEYERDVKMYVLEFFLPVYKVMQDNYMLLGRCHFF